LKQECCVCGAPGQVAKKTVLTSSALDEMSQQREARRAQFRELQRPAPRCTVSSSEDAWKSGKSGSSSSGRASTGLPPWRFSGASSARSSQKYRIHSQDTSLGASQSPQASRPRSQSPAACVAHDSSHERASSRPRSSSGSAIKALLAQVQVEEEEPPRVATDAHRPDLCEGCRRYGDCAGFFAEPIIAFAVARLLHPVGSLKWDFTDGFLKLKGGNSKYPLRIVPHIGSEGDPAQIDPDEAHRRVEAQRATTCGVSSAASISGSGGSASSPSRTIRTSEHYFLKNELFEEADAEMSPSEPPGLIQPIVSHAI